MERITNQKTNKFSKEKSMSMGIKIFVIVFLVVLTLSLTGVSIYSVVLSNENKQLKQNAGSSFTADNEIEVGENSSESIAISMVSNILSGVSYPQKIRINCKNVGVLQVLRAKAKVVNSDGVSYEAKLIATSDWINGDDGYYYYVNKVISPNLFTLCDYVELPIGFSVENKNSNKHVLVITAETISFNLDIISSIWTSAPNSWLTAIA